MSVVRNGILLYHYSWLTSINNLVRLLRLLLRKSLGFFFPRNSNVFVMTG